MTKSTTILCLFIAYSLAALCSKPPYYFKQIAVEQGLSQAHVNSILSDSKGTLWIGTKSGLNSFAQHELKSYYCDKENKYSLPDNYIQFVAEDSLNHLWVSTRKGLATYNAGNNQFNLIIRKKIYSFLCISGGILFGGEKMIYRYDYQRKKVESIPFPDQGPSPSPTDYNIIEMATLQNGKIIIGTRNKGLYTYDYRTKKVKSFIPNPNNILLSLHIGTDNTIYLSNYRKGISCYDLQGNPTASYTPNNSELKNNIVLDITEKDGNIWMGTDGDGINIFNPLTKKFTELRHIPGETSSLPVNSITVLYKDSENNLWAGSVRGGIFGIKQTFIKTYTDVPLNNTNGLSEKAVISMHEDDNGLLWIGTDGGGINLYNPHSEQFTHFPATYGDKVVSITDASETELLVSLYNKGMLFFNKKTGKYRPFTIVDTQTNIVDCYYGFIPKGYKISDDKIYILSYHSWVYHPHKRTFSHIQAEPGHITPDAFIAAYTSDSITYFIRENQVYEVNQKNDSLYALFTIDADEIINSIAYDNKETIWVGSSCGLGYYSLKSHKFQRISTKLFNNVSYLMPDGQGKLWINAQNMLFSYIISEGKFIVWSESDGYRPNEILSACQKVSKSNYIYLGGTEGLVKIDKGITYDDTLEPQIELANVLFNGSSYMSQLKEKSITIPWNYTSLSVSVGLNERDIFRKTMFRYIIVGMGRQYMESYNSKIDLPSLLPGTYSIWASCNTKIGNYTDPVQIIEITITPPWYKSVWFFSAIFLLLTGIVVAIVCFIIWKKENKLKWEMKVYEQSVNEEKIDFLVNISHELRTPLTLIYAPLKRLIDKSKESFEPDFVLGQLHTIYKQSRQMKNIINMVLDLNRLNAGREEVKKQAHPLNAWVKNVSADFTNEFEEKNIAVTYQLDERISHVWFDEWKCQIILSNLLINALKFSLPNTRITISTMVKDDKTIVSVSDQGIGLENVDIPQLFNRFYQGNHYKNGTGIGLSYSKMLIEKHGGRIGAYNNPDQGATFYFELPVIGFPVAPETKTVFTPSESAISLMQEGGTISIEAACAGHTILIVEDEPELRNFLHDALKELFKQVYTAENGLEALKVCMENQPDMVVSDVMMPHMDGYELCKQIKNKIEISHIPVVLLTARCDQDSVAFGYKLGADFYMPKPFETEFLLTIVCNLLHSRELIRQKYKDGIEIISPQEATISKGDEEFLIKFNEIIHTNLADSDLSIKFLTDAMCMSRASLYNKMKVVTGLGVNDYINRLRIDKASYLLTHTELNINEISYEVGFTYPRHFSTLFKQLKGVTPTQFKEKEKLTL